MDKKIYFLSDAHLGAWAIDDPKAHEQRLVCFLESVKYKASEVYMLGDMFDFWFEYSTVVPKGHVRFLGKVAELVDAGVKVHYFTGNHDMWTFGYLEQELGVCVYTRPLETTILGKRFYMAHGDGIKENNLTVKMIQAIFHSRVCQKLFRLLPPAVGMNFGLVWSKSNRKKHDAHRYEYQGEDKEPLVRFAKQYSESNNIDFYIFGHRHILLNLQLRDSRVVILGDWMSQFTYATFDGTDLELHHYEEAKL